MVEILNQLFSHFFKIKNTLRVAVSYELWEYYWFFDTDTLYRYQMYRFITRS